MNYKNKLKDLNGNDIDLTFGDAISNVLASSKSNDNVRSFTLAMEVRKDNPSLNESDINFIKSALEKADIFSPLVIGQVLLELDKK